MRRFVAPTRRGLTFLEFILALAITAMVALAITGMMTSVAMGQRLRRDNRAFVIRTHALKSRLSAYIAPCRSFLMCNGTDLTPVKSGGSCLTAPTASSRSTT
jgi:type II secretory pathway component PulJ